MGNSRVVAELPANLVREIKSVAALEGKTFKALLMEMINVKLESVKQVKNVQHGKDNDKTRKNNTR